jgi:hypothetical protein
MIASIVSMDHEKLHVSIALSTFNAWVASCSQIAAFVIAYAASIRGRSGLGWFFYALVFWL